MTVHEYVPQVYYNTMGSHAPVLRVKDGDCVKTSTLDARGTDRHGEVRAPRGNPVTGPFYVEGAEPGDTVAVQFESIIPNRDTGFSATTLAPHVVEASFVKQLPTRDIVFWKIDDEKKSARLVGPLEIQGEMILPLSPFLGCFGVAPPLGQAISTETSGPHGGNMDYRGFVAGVTVYFPVFTEGALLFFGDGHAFQGDGEITGTGLEISMDICFKVNVLKGKTIHWPRGETDSHIFTVGNANPLQLALQHATTEMCRWLMSDYGMDVVEASILLGQCVEYEIGNVYNPAHTIICKLHKDRLPQIRT